MIKYRSLSRAIKRGHLVVDFNKGTGVLLVSRKVNRHKLVYYDSFKVSA